MRYLSFAVAGLEWVAVEELKLAGATNIHVIEQNLQVGLAALGKIIFSLDKRDSIAIIAGLHSVQRVLALICAIPNDVGSG